jgi:hypothetical protein
MKTMTLDEFLAALKSQGVPREHLALKCPICGTVQSAYDLIKAGAGNSFDEVEKYLGFSCVGRFTNAGPYKKGKSDVVGCDWTLGGLFQLHKLAVIVEGKEHPRFEPVLPNEAKAHMAREAQ